MGCGIPQLSDLLTLMFDLGPGIFFYSLERAPRVYQLGEGVRLSLNWRHVILHKDVVGVLWLLEVLLCTFLALDKVRKRRLTDGCALVLRVIMVHTVLFERSSGVTVLPLTCKAA